MPKTKLNVDKTIITAFTPLGKRRCFLQGAGIKNHSIILFLSILHNDYCTKDYLKEILKQVMAKNNELSVTCLITDEVYWHNLKGMTTSVADEQAFKQQAIELGLQYLKTNLPIFLNAMHQYNSEFSIDQFSLDFGDKSIADQIKALNNSAIVYKIPLQIVLWKEWTSDEEYLAKKEQFTAFAKSIPHLKEAIEETANSFARRMVKREVDAWDTVLASCEKNKKFELFYSRSIDYVSEECFALYFLAGKRNQNLIGYPHRMEKAFREIQQFIITDKNTTRDHPDFRIRVDKPDTLANWIDIDTSILDAAIAQATSFSHSNLIASYATPTTAAYSPSSVISFSQQYDALKRNGGNIEPTNKPNRLRRTKSYGGNELNYNNYPRQSFFSLEPISLAQQKGQDQTDKTQSRYSPILTEIVETIGRLKSLPPNKQKDLIENFVKNFGIEPSRQLAEQILTSSALNHEQLTQENTVICQA